MACPSARLGLALGLVALGSGPRATFFRPEGPVLSAFVRPEGPVLSAFVRPEGPVLSFGLKGRF